MQDDLKASSLDVEPGKKRYREVGEAEVMQATTGDENIFVDCGFPPAEAENLRIRAKMMMALTGYIQERKITQSRAPKS